MKSRRKHKLDCLKSKSQGTENEAPTCAVSKPIPKTSSLWQGVGEVSEKIKVAFTTNVNRPESNRLGFRLKAGLGFVRTNVRIRWNTVYRAFHRSCGNEAIVRNEFKHDLDAANLRPSLEQGCRKQTPSASILFSPQTVLSVSSKPCSSRL